MICLSFSNEVSAIKPYYYYYDDDDLFLYHCRVDTVQLSGLGGAGQRWLEETGRQQSDVTALVYWGDTVNDEQIIPSYRGCDLGQEGRLN